MLALPKQKNKMPSPFLTPTLPLPPPSIRCTTIRNTPSLARFLSLQMSRLMLLLTRKSASLLRSGRLKTLSFVRPDPSFYVFILELFSSTLSSPSCIIELPIALPRSAHKNQQLLAFMLQRYHLSNFTLFLVLPLLRHEVYLCWFELQIVLLKYPRSTLSCCLE